MSLRGALALTVTLAVVFWAVLIGSAGLRRSSSSDVVPPYLGALAVCLMLVVVRRWFKALTPGRMIVIALSWLISGGLVYPLGYYHGGVGDILFIMLLPAVVGLGVAYWLLH